MKGKALITIVLIAASNLAVAGIGGEMELSYKNQTDKLSTQSSVSNNHAKMKIQDEFNHGSHDEHHYDAVTNKFWQLEEDYDFTFDYSSTY